MRSFTIWLIAGVATLGAMTAAAQPAQDPDWPCIQRMVPALAPGLVWTGPPLDGVAGSWRDDPALAALVEQVTAPTAMAEDAAAAVEAYAGGLAQAERAPKLTLLFAGIFERLDAERSRAVRAALTFGRGQRRYLADIAERLATIDSLRAANPPDQAQIGTLEDEVALGRRIFEDRRRSLTALCDQPVDLERRLGALSRTIEALLG